MRTNIRLKRDYFDLKKGDSGYIEKYYFKKDGSAVAIVAINQILKVIPINLLEVPANEN